MNSIQGKFDLLDWEQSTADLQELLADALLELKLSRCKEAVSERMKSILQKKLQLAKDETLWVLDKVIKDKEEILRLLGLEIASQQFGITSLRLECHQREHRALFLEKKAECTRVEANTLQGACTIIKEENAARTMNGLAVTHRALEQAVQLRDLKKELHDLRDSEAELQGQLFAANSKLLKQEKDLHESRSAGETQQLARVAAEQRAQEELQILAEQSEDLQRKARSAEKDAVEARSQMLALEGQLKERESVLERRLQLLEENRALAEQATKERLQNAHDCHLTVEKDLKHQMQAIHERLQHERHSWRQAEKELLDTKRDLQRKLAAATEDLENLQYQLELKEKRISELQRVNHHARLQSPYNLNAALKTVSSLVDDLVPTSVLPKPKGQSGAAQLTAVAGPGYTTAPPLIQLSPSLPLPTTLQHSQQSKPPVHHRPVRRSMRAGVMQRALEHQSTNESSKDIPQGSGFVCENILGAGSNAGEKGSQGKATVLVAQQASRVPGLKINKATAEPPILLDTEGTEKVISPTTVDHLQHHILGEIPGAGPHMEQQTLDAFADVRKNSEQAKSGADASNRPGIQNAVATDVNENVPEGACAPDPTPQPVMVVTNSKGPSFSNGSERRTRARELKRKSDVLDPPQAGKRAKVVRSKQVNKEVKGGANIRDGSINMTPLESSQGKKEGAKWKKARRNAPGTKGQLGDGPEAPHEDGSKPVAEAKARHKISPVDLSSAKPAAGSADQRRPVRQRKSGVPYWMGTAPVQGSAPQEKGAKISRDKQRKDAEAPASCAVSNVGPANNPTKPPGRPQTKDPFHEKDASQGQLTNTQPGISLAAPTEMTCVSGDGGKADVVQKVAAVQQGGPEAANGQGTVFQKTRARKSEGAAKECDMVPSQITRGEEGVGRQARLARTIHMITKVNNVETVKADGGTVVGHPSGSRIGALKAPRAEDSMESPIAGERPPGKLTRIRKLRKGEDRPLPVGTSPGGMPDNQTGDAILSGDVQSKKVGKRKSANPSAENARLPLRLRRSDAPAAETSQPLGQADEVGAEQGRKPNRRGSARLADHIPNVYTEPQPQQVEGPFEDPALPVTQGQDVDAAKSHALLLDKMAPAAMPGPEAGGQAPRDPAIVLETARSRKSEEAVQQGSSTLLAQRHTRSRAATAPQRAHKGEVASTAELNGIKGTQTEADTAIDHSQTLAAQNSASPAAHPNPAGRGPRGTKRSQRGHQGLQVEAKGIGIGGSRLKAYAAGNEAGPSLKKLRRPKAAMGTAEAVAGPLDFSVSPAQTAAVIPARAGLVAEGGDLMQQPDQTATAAGTITPPDNFARSQQQQAQALPAETAMTTGQGPDASISDVKHVPSTAARIRLGRRASAVVPVLKEPVSKHQKPANPQRKVSRIDLNTLWGEEVDAVNASKGMAAAPAGGSDVWHPGAKQTNNAILPPDPNPPPAINDRPRGVSRFLQPNCKWLRKEAHGVLEAAAIRVGAPNTAFVNRTMQQLKHRTSMDKGPKRKLLPAQNVVDVAPMGMLLGSTKNSFILPRLLNKRTL